MWIRAVPGFAPLLISLTLLIGAAPFGQAAEHTVPANIDQTRWEGLLARINPGDGLTFESPTPYRVRLGELVGKGRYGVVYRLADESDRVIKMTTEHIPHSSQQAPASFPFLEEVAALRALDSTSIRHSRVFSTLGNLAVIKEYVEGHTLEYHFENWQEHDFETHFKLIRNLAKLAREIQTQNIRLGDAVDRNIVIQAGTLLPYIIDPASVTIDAEGLFEPERYILWFIERAVPKGFHREAVWLDVVHPVLLRSFLRTEELARELRQSPTQAAQESLAQEIQHFDRLNLRATQDGILSNEVRTQRLADAKRRVRGLMTDILRDTRYSDLSVLRGSLCSTALTQAN